MKNKNGKRISAKDAEKIRKCYKRIKQSRRNLVDQAVIIIQALGDLDYQICRHGDVLRKFLQDGVWLETREAESCFGVYYYADRHDEEMRESDAAQEIMSHVGHLVDGAKDMQLAVNKFRESVGISEECLVQEQDFNNNVMDRLQSPSRQNIESV